MNFLFFFLCFFCTGCDFFKKPPLVIAGKRIPLEKVEAFAQVAGPYSKDLARDIPLENRVWPEAGCTPFHTFGPFALSQTLTLKKKFPYVSDAYISTPAPIITESGIFVLTHQGSVCAFDKEGKKIWERSLLKEYGKKYPLIEGGLSSDAHHIYATTPEGYLVALEILSGKEVWRSFLGLPSRSAPALSPAYVIVLTWDNRVLAFDKKTGHSVWTHGGLKEEASFLSGSVPALGADRVIVACSSGEVMALSLDRGEVLWTQNGSTLSTTHEGRGLAHIRAMPVIYKNCVYTVSYNGQFTCFDYYTGQIKWSCDLGGSHPPVVAEHSIFCLSKENVLVALDQRGHQFWTCALPKGSWSGPLWAGNFLYVLSDKGVLLALDPLQKGKCVHRYTVGEHCEIAPIAAAGGLFILSQQGTLFFYGAKGVSIKNK